MMKFNENLRKFNENLRKFDENIKKKTKKPLKIGSVQPDLDQTLSKFC